MGRTVEKLGKTVQDAINAALDELELTIDDVHVDVLDEGKTSLFGMISNKPAKVRISELDEDEKVPQPGQKIADQNRNIEKVSDVQSDGYGLIGGRTSQNTVPTGAPGNQTVEGRGGTARAGSVRAGKYENRISLDGKRMRGADDSNRAAGRDTAGEFAGDYSDGNVDGNIDTDIDADIDSDDGVVIGAGIDGPLGEDVDRAVYFLKQMFSGMHISSEMTADITDEGFSINIESDDSGILIGHRGETLDAIQYITNLFLNRDRDEFVRASVDVENYKKKREAALKRLAERMADKVVRLRRNFTLDAMNSYERRIVHSVLQNHPKVETYSVGEDPNRKVVVTLKNRGNYSSR